MAKLRVGVDMDGVLAKFNQAYGALIEGMFTHVKFPDIDDEYFPKTWNWEKAHGLDRKDCSRVWKSIKEDGNFWFDLAPFHDAVDFLNKLKFFNADVYFVTSRVGDTSKDQTEEWLTKHGWNDLGAYPTVLISSEKGLCAKALDLTHYIDDKNENCLDVQNDSPKTKGYMLARPWNQEQFGIPRIGNLGEFIEVLRQDNNG